MLKAGDAPQISRGMPPTEAVEEAYVVGAQITPEGFTCPGMHPKVRRGRLLGAIYDVYPRKEGGLRGEPA